MIRIDEIYTNVFWSWMQKKQPGTRLFFCDPPGHNAPENLFNFGNPGIEETDYVFFHDQEPADIDLYRSLFDTVIRRNKDIKKQPPGHVIVGEQGQKVRELCDHYGWRSHYYFYHGWACQDWFRGYDRTFLLPRARNRMPQRTFMSPNRIVGGYRDHRVLFLYHVFKNGLSNNHISAPRICPHESTDITETAAKYCSMYPDIVQVLNHADLPITFAGEDVQKMTSCWLDNFLEAADSLFYVPTETVYFGSRLHLTEKTFKAIALEMPFVLVAPAGSLEYLRSYGFKTFNSVIDERYDDITDDHQRLQAVCDLLKDIESMSHAERWQLHRHMLPMIEHNYNHFYRGDFAEVLWQELLQMLETFNV